MEKDTELIDYLLGRLSETDQQAFEKTLALDPQLELEAESLQKTWQALQELEATPDASMDTSFYALLDREKQNQQVEQQREKEIAFVPKKWAWFRYVAVLAAFGLMFWLGRLTVTPKVEVRTVMREKLVPQPLQLPSEEVAVKKEAINPPEKTPATLTGVRKEIATLRKELKVTQELVILGLLRKESAAERLKGLQYASNLPTIKPHLLETLAQTLRQDENINVRLATIETLRKYGQSQEVREAVLTRLNIASELPEQLSAMETLVTWHEKNAIPRLKALSEDETASPIIRQKAQQSIQLLTI
ncbi:MAG: hypothetical protein QM669_14905 [Siphonobacter sp.]